MAPERHALLGPSSAARWLACPPSARLEAAVPNEGTKYTREGTLAHAICELKLQSYFTVINKRTYSTRLNKLKKDELYAPEMEQHTDAYAEYIKEQSLSFASKPLVMIEDKVDFCRWVPEGFGTADCVMLHGDTLIVVDFKYGKGHAVSAVDNPQMKLYALGAYEKYRMLYSPTRIKMAIVQPRISDAPEEWETTLPELLKWAEETVKPAAALAFAGEGEQHGGDHCRFCRVKGQCRAYAAPYISAAEDFSKLDKPKEPALLTNEEIGNALTLAKPLAAWLSAVEDYALEAVLSGRMIPYRRRLPRASGKRRAGGNAVRTEAADAGTGGKAGRQKGLPARGRFLRGETAWQADTRGGKRPAPDIQPRRRRFSEIELKRSNLSWLTRIPLISF